MCKYANVQDCKCARVQLCKCANFQVCQPVQSLNVCQFFSVSTRLMAIGLVKLCGGSVRLILLPVKLLFPLPPTPSGLPSVVHYQSTISTTASTVTTVTTSIFAVSVCTTSSTPPSFFSLVGRFRMKIELSPRVEFPLAVSFTSFLDAPSHLYKRVCPSVRP